VSVHRLSATHSGADPGDSIAGTFITPHNEPHDDRPRQIEW
jgi:hypothetical protein